MWLGEISSEEGISELLSWWLWIKLPAVICSPSLEYLKTLSLTSNNYSSFPLSPCREQTDQRKKKNLQRENSEREKKKWKKNQRKNQEKIDKTLEDFLSSSISVPCCIEYQKFSSRFSVRGRIKWVLLSISCCGKLNLLASVNSWSESDIDQLSCYHGSVV